MAAAEVLQMTSPKSIDGANMHKQHVDPINNPGRGGVDIGDNANYHINTKNINWLLALSGPDGNDVLSNIKKEQNSDGLEALGDVAADADKSAPMDDNGSDDFGDSKNKPIDESGAVKNGPEDDTSSDGSDSGNDSTSGGDTPNTVDGKTEDENVGGTGDLTDQADSSDNSSGVIQDDDKQDISNDPHLSLNRRILLSTKFLELYDSIKDSVTMISNGPAFANKPVVLESLIQLQNKVLTINESINKEPDHKALLLRYAVCVKTYSRIIGK